MSRMAAHLKHRKVQTSTAMTLADVLRAITPDENLGDAQKRDCRSAINSLCRTLNIRPDDAPATLDWLRQKSSTLHPQQICMSAKRLANIRSSVAFAIKRFAMDAPRSRGRDALSAPWDALWALLPQGNPRYRLSRFLKFLSQKGYGRADVDDDAIPLFLIWLRDSTTAKNPEAVAKQTVRTWNRAVADILDWPQAPLADIWRHKGYTSRWLNLPATLRKEADAWFEVLRSPDILDEHAPAAPLSSETIKARQFQIRQAVGALAQVGAPLPAAATLRDLITAENLRIVLRFVLDRSDGKPSSQSAGIATAFVLIAEHWLRVGPEDLANLRSLKRKVTPASLGMS